MEPASDQPPKKVTGYLTLFIGLCGGLLAFVLSMVVGFFVIRTILVFLYPPRTYTEAYEGFGEAMFVWHWFLLGMGLWLVISVFLATWACEILIRRFEAGEGAVVTLPPDSAMQPFRPTQERDERM